MFKQTNEKGISSRSLIIIIRNGFKMLDTNENYVHYNGKKFVSFIPQNQSTSWTTSGRAAKYFNGSLTLH